MKKRHSDRTLVTMRDVAKVAGVSCMTVSRALKENSLIAEDTRDKILKIVKEMNYVPHQLASNLTTGKSGFIGVVLPSLNNLHFAKTIQSLTDNLEDTGLQILLGHSNYSSEREERIVETMLRRRPEAIVLSYDGHTERTHQLLNDVPIPIVEIWETPEHPIQHTVGFSNHTAAFEMTQALIEKGFQNIVFLSEVEDDWTRGAARRSGFEGAMTESGRSIMSVRYGAPPLSIKSGAEAVSQILEMFPNIDCIFCVSDMAAFGVQSRLLQMGIKVPDEISVIGFGDFEVSRFSSPTISTVVVNPSLIGRETAKILKDILIENPDNPDISHHIRTAPHLDFRESCRL